jgi:hypothetical protein
MVGGPVNPSVIVKLIDEFLGELVGLQTMMEQGFGNVAFRRKINLISGRANQLRSMLAGSPEEKQVEHDPGLPKEVNVALATDRATEDQSLMLSGPDGSKRIATSEEIEELRKAGAPVDLPREDIDDVEDFFGDSEEIVR